LSKGGASLIDVLPPCVTGGSLKNVLGVLAFVYEPMVSPGRRNSVVKKGV
jgi:hypothetical protein